jgi:exopolyphosphatase/guanosine-5'-triphosphate,3'-diphosphate pyrophosphatase
LTDHFTIAAIDLGSNSFHCQIARSAGNQFYPLDGLREPVRLGAGLDADKVLSEESQERALQCLARFGERLRGLDRHQVRAIGTNTLRIAKNAPAFLRRARSALGFPIEVVAGREEARLIYVGVAHSLPVTRERRLVIDIGGGSTECIIGTGYKPLQLESLFMGCVSYSLRFFPHGMVTKSNFKAAVLAARAELQPMADQFSSDNWSHAVGASGTVRAIADLLKLLDYSDGTITLPGLERLRHLLMKSGDINLLELPGLRADRRPVLPGGLAILYALFNELAISSLSFAPGAMRQGILYDMLGRFHHQDMRDVTATQFMQRYHVDERQFRRVSQTASALFAQLDYADDNDAQQLLLWATQLHEIGIPVAYSGYHRHSAYIISNADMPGFSKDEQARLASIVLSHRRSLRKTLPAVIDDCDHSIILALRIAVLLQRARRDQRLPIPKIRLQSNCASLQFDAAWLNTNPLTATALREEVKEWQEVGFTLKIPALEHVEFFNDDNGDE